MKGCNKQVRKQRVKHNNDNPGFLLNSSGFLASKHSYSSISTHAAHGGILPLGSPCISFLVPRWNCCICPLHCPSRLQLDCHH